MEMIVFVHFYERDMFVITVVQVEAWRKDFVTFMQPKFLPEDWSPDKDWRAVSEVELEAERRVMYAEHLRHLGKEVPINDKPIRPARR